MQLDLIEVDSPNDTLSTAGGIHVSYSSRTEHMHIKLFDKSSHTAKLGKQDVTDSLIYLLRLLQLCLIVQDMT